MRVPKGVMSVAKVSATEDTRYAFKGVLLRREKDDRISATATDGRRLLTVSWKDNRTKPLPGIGEEDAPNGKFQAIIPSRAALRAQQSLPRSLKDRKYDAPSLVIDEKHSNGTVHLLSPDADGMQRFEYKVVEGKFPPFEEVIPKHSVVEGKKGEAARIGVDARLLIGLLESMLAATPSADNRGTVVIEIPMQPNRPIKFTRGNEKDADGRYAVGVLMPVQLT